MPRAVSLITTQLAVHVDDQPMHEHRARLPGEVRAQRLRHTPQAHPGGGATRRLGLLKRRPQKLSAHQREILLARVHRVGPLR